MIPRVEKLWGYEEHIVNHVVSVSEFNIDHGYCGKRLTVLPGCQCSLHYHILKHETFLVVEGMLVVELGPDGYITGPTKTNVYHPNEVITVPPHTLHRFWAAGFYPAVFYEFSTIDRPEDSLRVTISKRRDHDLPDTVAQ